MTTVRHDYPADVETVFARLIDPGYLKRRSEAQGHLNVEVEVTEEGEAVVVRVSRDVESEIPGFMKKLFSPRNHVVDVTTWRPRGDRRVATYTVEVGARVHLDGELELAPRGDGSAYTDSFTAKVRVPVVGKKVAAYVEKETAAAIRLDCAFMVRDLAGG